MLEKKGYFVISLDFELFWGMSDKYTLESYGPNVLGERTAIPRMLKLFSEYAIHATWATVGMVMARDRNELLSLLPPKDLRPVYDDPRMSTYYDIEHGKVGTNESDDPYHFGSSLVEHVMKTPHQEIGNHSFSHYYAIDGNKNACAVLSRDLDTHAAIAKTYGVTSSSVVFPRNQFDEATLDLLFQKGVTAYRGNESSVLYQARKDSEHSLLIRGLRFIDHYINLSGHHTYPIPRKLPGKPYNVAASRFLRPFMPALFFLEPLRIRRIKKAMTYAAKRGEIFHLWWHPHNMGIHQEENFKNLETILKHFVHLRSTYGMESASMHDIATIADGRVT